MNKKIVTVALLTATATVLSIVEGFVPMPAVIYGAKPGLANVVTMVALALLSPVEALGITVVRVLLSAVVTGAFTALPYGLCGGVAAWLIMTLIYKFMYPEVTFVGISVCGAVFHSFAQVTVAVLITGTLQVYWYYPYLMLAAAVTGVFTGICTNCLLPYLKKYRKD